VVALSGLGGMGKTQLAISFAKRHREMFSFVFWLSAKSERTLKVGLTKVAERVLEKDQHRMLGSEDENRAIKQVREWLSKPNNNRWLLIFDNYDDPQTSGEKNVNSFKIKNYFPYTSQGSILITTRGTRLTYAKIIQLKKLETEQGLALLAQRSKRPGAEQGLNTSFFLKYFNINS